MTKFRFTINLAILYSEMGTEYDETPEELMNYEDFVEFVKNADIRVLETRIGDYLVIEGDF